MPESTITETEMPACVVLNFTKSKINLIFQRQGYDPVFLVDGTKEGLEWLAKHLPPNPEGKYFKVGLDRAIELISALMKM
jgi:hypothetical protein